MAGAVLLTLSKTSPEQNEVRWYVYLYFTVITFLFHAGLENASRNKPQAFIRYYMGGTTFKLLIHLGVIVIYSIFHKTEAVPFIIAFMIFYLCFTAFDVAVSWGRFRK